MIRRPAPAGRTGRLALAGALIAAALSWTGIGRTTAAAPAELISVDPNTGAALITQDSTPSVSGDGKTVAFTALPPIGSEFFSDWVWVRNRTTGVTTPVPSPYQPPDQAATTGGVLSRDGCHVAYWGFVPFHQIVRPLFVLNIPAQWDVYVWDICTAGATPVWITRAAGFPTLATSGTDRRGPLGISADGRYVVYNSFDGATGAERIARIDTSGTITEDVLNGSVFNVNSLDVSDNGAFVAIGGQMVISDISRNVVAGWTPPCVAGVTLVCNVEVVSVDNNGNAMSNGNNNPSVSADGRYVAFVSSGTEIVGPVGAKLPQIYVRDRVAGVTKLVSATPPQPMNATMDDPDISPDGFQIALVQASPVKEVFVARSTAGYFDAATFDLVSYGVSGAPVSADAFSPSMSSTGRFVAFSSTANTELSGVRSVNGLEVWMRSRPISLDITPSIDFGTLDVGTASAPKTAVVTNTSSAAINLGAVAAPSAPFTMTATTCGGVLQPAATCTITIVFTPAAPGSASSSVGVAGDGLSVSASLVGAGRSNIKPGSLVIKPTSANYGTGPLGTVIPPKRFTVSNPGQTPVQLAGVGIGGAGADQFQITATTCATAVAALGTCTVDVGATITREGSLSATLEVVGTGGQTAQATLRIAAVFTPTLKMNPGVVSPGEVTVAIGAGFPPNIDVQLAFDGEAPLATVHTDGAGAFRFDFLVLRNGIRIGGRQVSAVDQPDFSGVHAPLLIDLATYRPSGFDSANFAGTVRAMYTRGG